MNCDHCGQDHGDVFAKRPAIPDGEFWCSKCCDQLGIALGPWRDWQPIPERNVIRERYEAERKAKAREKLDQFLKNKQQTDQTSRKELRSSIS